jgi:hypothetical protein
MAYLATIIIVVSGVYNDADTNRTVATPSGRSQTFNLVKILISIIASMTVNAPQIFRESPSLSSLVHRSVGLVGFSEAIQHSSD